MSSAAFTDESERKLPSADRALRDLESAEFQALYCSDRFTAGVLANRMRYVMKHMSTGLLRSAFSMILRDWYDFATTLSGPPEMDYPMSAGSDSMLMFMGTMPEGVRNAVEEFGHENLRPGDVLITNDPYRVGLHVNDVAFIRPVFYQDRIVSFVAVRAHQLDMGGIVPAGFSGTKRSVYETGLVIPPTLLYRKDKPVRSVFSLIFDNARYCSLLLPDIKSLHQSLLLGEKLLLESIERYGIDAYLGAIRYSCDVAAEAMRQAIRTKIPDGIYEAEDLVDADGMDDSRMYRIKLKLTKFADNLEIDFSGTSGQARTSINCGPLDVKATVGTALKMLIEQSTPFTSGCYRNIDIVLPPSTLCSATPPHGPVFIYWEPLSVIVLLLYRALADVLGEDAIGGDFGSLIIHAGNGLKKDGSPWVTAAVCGAEHGPWGASKAGDGDSYNGLQFTNNLDPAIEAIEADAPVIVMRKEYVQDTAGAGFNRGGAAVIKDTLWLTAAQHSSAGPFHARLPSGTGVYGGGTGTGQASWAFPPDAFDIARESRPLPTDSAIYKVSEPIGGLLDPETKQLRSDGQYFYFASKTTLYTTPGTTLRYQTCGGGGWGNPTERDPNRVMRDVRDEYISSEAAYRDYGVVLSGNPATHPEQLQIDFDATAKRRMEMTRQLGTK